jgi:hypothetical protein
VRFNSRLMVLDADMVRLVGEKVTALKVAGVLAVNVVVRSCC